MDQIVRTGDTVQFMPNFGAALVTVAPTTITGSAAGVNVVGMTACVEGDEKTVILAGLPYISGSFVTPGICTLTIQQLGSDQLSQKTTIGGKKVILKGTTFTAKMQVTSPAMQPTPGGPVPDPVVMGTGSGMFITTNMTVTDGG